MGGLTDIFGGKHKSVKPYEPEDVPTYEAEAEATSQSVRDAEAARRRKRRGMSGNILTSALGVKGKSTLG